MKLLDKQKYENWQVGDTFALKLDNRYLILVLYGTPYATSCEVRCKFRAKITKDEQLPKNQEKIEALEFIKVQYKHFYTRYLPLNAYENYEEGVIRQKDRKFYPDEFNYLYYYLFEVLLLKRSNIYKELIYLGNFDINLPIDDYRSVDGDDKLFFLKELKDELYKCYNEYNLRKSSIYEKDSIIEIKKNALVRVNAEIVKPTEEELWKMYGPIIKKEKKKKRDTLTKVK